MCTLHTDHLAWPDHVYTAFATAITANPNPSIEWLSTDKDLAPFVPDVPQAVRDGNARSRARVTRCFTNKPLLKYIQDERATKWRPRRDVLRVLCEVGQVVSRGRKQPRRSVSQV